jgi:hypothetical protein
MRRKIYEASDGTVSIYHNSMIKTFNSFEEIENLDVIEFLESKYIYLENIKPLIKKLEDGYEISFQNGRKEFSKTKASVYFDFPYEEN